MTCEPCWTEASRRALVFGGCAADFYREVLAEHEAATDRADTSASTSHFGSHVEAE